jgi:HlyD family secretion protein
MRIIACLALAACGSNDNDDLAGYVEADTLLMSAQDPGRIAEIAVKEGDRVAAGAVLFRLDPERATYALAEAEAAAAAAKARSENAGALDQAVAEAEAEFERAQKAFDRSRELVRTNVATRARLDNDRAAVDSAKARLERARSERDAATREWAGADAMVGLARRRLADHVVTAPQSGSIERVYRRAGEIVAAGEPVVALLPPGNFKIRFYAPETRLSSLALGDEVGLSCDGCAAGLTARLSHIAAEPQFTPPVIYSLKERKKLVFLVEARPAATDGLHPGLPVTVRLE